MAALGRGHLIKGKLPRLKQGHDDNQGGHFEDDCDGTPEKFELTIPERTLIRKTFKLKELSENNPPLENL